MSIFTRTARCPGCGNSAKVRDDQAFNAAFEEELYASWKCRECGTVLMPRFFGRTIAVPGPMFDAQFKKPPDSP